MRWASRNMSRKPKCIIITGQPGSRKTTLAKKLGERLWMPVISRDEIKEGYVNTYGVKPLSEYCSSIMFLLPWGSL